MAHFDESQKEFWDENTNLRPYDHPVMQAFANQRVDFIRGLLGGAGIRSALEEVCVNATWRAKMIFAASHLVSLAHISVPALHIHTDVVLNFFTLGELDEAFARLGLRVVEREVMKFPGLGARLATFGDTTHHVLCVLERA
jgi:hypothetical protein